MDVNPMKVLDTLVRSNLWSVRGNLSTHKYLILDAESVLRSLHRHCMLEHLQRAQSHHNDIQSATKDKSKEEDLDLYALTLINYQELTKHIELVLDYILKHLKLKLIVVYEGKHMEAPLFGYLAARFETNIRLLTQAVSLVANYDAGKSTFASNSYTKLATELPSTRSQLDLIIFKSIINDRRKSGANILVHQAFYKSAPLIARLARDFHCPVVTDDAAFILFDVRAGYVLFEDLFRRICNSKHANPREDVSSIRLQSNYLFIRQHPGLNPALALHLFPLLTGDLMTTHEKSLRKIHVLSSLDSLKSCSSSSPCKRHHSNAALLEMSLDFVCGKSIDLICNLVRGEATRLNSSFDVDYRQVFNYNCVGFDFKQRLRYILKYMDSPRELNFIEHCLTDRECSADFYLSLFCCAKGRLASVNYNRYIQLEDLQACRSAYSLANHCRSVMMSLLSNNRSHEGERSISANKQSQNNNKNSSNNNNNNNNNDNNSPKINLGLNLITRYDTAALTIIDRHRRAKLGETNISTTYGSKVDNDNVLSGSKDDCLLQFNKLKDRISLDKIASGQVVREDSARLIEFALKLTASSTELPKQIESEICKQNQLKSLDLKQKREIGLLLSLFRYAVDEASEQDGYFKANYLSQKQKQPSLRHHFDVALVNHYCLLNNVACNNRSSSTWKLRDMIIKNGLDQTSQTKEDCGAFKNTQTDYRMMQQQTGSSLSPSSPVSLTTTSGNRNNSRRVRHLIEMFESTLSTYVELNAFLNYPLPRFDLCNKYNPILLYNLVLYSQSTSHKNKPLIHF